MTVKHSVVFAEPVRTAIGALGGSLKEVPAPKLGAEAIRAAIARAKLTPGDVQTVVMGNVVQAGAKMNPARQAAVYAGLPVTTPVLTVNRVCGSGAQASSLPRRKSGLATLIWPLQGAWGEHGSRSVSRNARPLGLPHG